MMICPGCNARYEDDTLRFCLEDGTPLVPGAVTDAPTVAFGDIETVVSARGPRNTSGFPDQGRSTNFVSPQPHTRKSNTGLAVLLTALGMLVIFGIAAGAWVYFSGRRAATTQNNSVTSLGPSNNGTTNSKPNTRVSPTPASNSWSNVSPSPAEPVNAEEIKNEVEKTINTWKSMAESHDLDSYMGNYAATVDYYLRKGVSRSVVRADKQKAFDRFDSMEFDISNVEITVAPSGDEANALFDKEWVFEADGETRSKGKVRQQMQFKRASGEWLITAERDIKDYSTN